MAPRRKPARRAPARPARVLVTGFGPFPGVPANPTAAIVRRLARRWPGPRGFRVAFETLPTEWGTLAALPALIARHRPDAVVLTGVAVRSDRVGLERTARGAAGRIPDAAGRLPDGVHLPARGARVSPVAGRLPALAAAIRHRAPAGISDDAGAYLCNASYLVALAARPAGPVPPRVVFVHVPPPRPARGRRLDDLSAAVAAVAAALAGERPPRPQRGW